MVGGLKENRRVRRGRPAQTDSSLTRERILETALDLFGETGADGISIRTVGAHSHVTLTTVHHHFGTKQALYHAVLERVSVRLQKAVDELVAGDIPTSPLAARVERAVRQAFRSADQNQSALRVMLRAQLASGEGRDERLREQIHAWLQRATSVVQPLTRAPARHVYLQLQNTLFLLVRSAIGSAAERMLTTRQSDSESATRMMEQVLVETAVTLLCDHGPRRSSKK